MKSKVFFPVLFVIMSIILNGCCCCTPPSDVSKENKNPQVSVEKNQKQEEEKNYRLNQTFTQGDFKYTFTRTTAARSIGNEYTMEKASEGAVFVILYFTEENISTESKTVFSDRFTLIDNRGREFSPSSKGNSAMAFTSDNKDFLLSEIHPGIKHKSVIVFEIPEDAKNLFIKIPGGWTEEEAKVSL